MTITYDQKSIGVIMTFEKLTKAHVKNCVMDKTVLFVVKEGDAGKAIGKNGMNIQRLSKLLKKPVRIVEYSEDPVTFVKNLIKNTNSKVYKSTNGEITIEPHTSKDKGIILGRDKQNLKLIQDILSTHHKTVVKVL